MELLKSKFTPRSNGSTQQHGVVLIVTLIILILMTLATVSVVRSMDTGNVIAGNFAFKQAAMQASDRAITDAMNNLANIIPSGGGNTSQTNRYSNVILTPLDSLGVPTAINWASIPCRDQANNLCNPAVDNGTYRVQYFIERRCYSQPNLSDNNSIKTNCDYEESGGNIALRYRVIIRVQGPRNTLGMYEVMLSGPVTS